MSLMHPDAPNLAKLAHDVGAGHIKQSKGKPKISYGLAGRFYISHAGWGLLHVPNSLVRGAFDALAEPGVELPPGHKDGNFQAHISVLRPEEIEEIGGVSKITERGHSFRYTLGKVKEVVPDGWDEYGKVWLIEVKSPELQKFRKSYGLTALPKNNRFEFHITIGVRKKRVLTDSEVSKA